MAKFMFLAASIALAAIATGAQATPEDTIESEEEFLARLANGGRPLTADQVQALLQAVDLEAEVEVDFVESETLLDLSRVSARYCHWDELAHRQRLCKLVRSSVNMQNYCQDRVAKQVALCRSKVDELFAEALADLSQTDRKLGEHFAASFESIDASQGDFAQRAGLAASKLLESIGEQQVSSSCTNLVRRLRLVGELAKGRPSSEALASWLEIYDLCNRHLKSQ